MASQAKADLLSWQVQWDISNLRDGYYSDGPRTTYYFGAQLINGGLNYSTAVRLHSFDMGGGMWTDLDYRTNAAAITGSVFQPSVTLTDLDFFNGYVARFEPGSKLSFLMNTNDTGNGSNSFPDSFSFALYKAPPNPNDVGLVELDLLVPIGTLEPMLLTASARTDFNGQPPVWETFASFASQIDDSRSIPAPVITPYVTPQPVPEPASVVTLGGGLALLALGRFRR